MAGRPSLRVVSVRSFKIWGISGSTTIGVLGRTCSVCSKETLLTFGMACPSSLELTIGSTLDVALVLGLGWSRFWPCSVEDGRLAPIQVPLCFFRREPRVALPRHGHPLISWASHLAYYHPCYWLTFRSEAERIAVLSGPDELLRLHIQHAFLQNWLQLSSDTVTFFFIKLLTYRLGASQASSRSLIPSLCGARPGILLSASLDQVLLILCEPVNHVGCLSRWMSIEAKSTDPECWQASTTYHPLHSRPARRAGHGLVSPLDPKGAAPAWCRSLS